MRAIIFTISLLVGFPLIAKEKKEKVIYEYKKYEKFDFEEMVIEGEIASPGDLSVDLRYQGQFKNKLPYRKNFNAEIRKGIERVR